MTLNRLFHPIIILGKIYWIHPLVPPTHCADPVLSREQCLSFAPREQQCLRQFGPFSNCANHRHIAPLVTIAKEHSKKSWTTLAHFWAISSWPWYIPSPSNPFITRTINVLFMLSGLPSLEIVLVPYLTLYLLVCFYLCAHPHHFPLFELTLIRFAHSYGTILLVRIDHQLFRECVKIVQQKCRWPMDSEEPHGILEGIDQTGKGPFCLCIILAIKFNLDISFFNFG